MNVWIDIYHIPQFNFYISFIRQLVAAGHKVELTVLSRGRLPRVVENDLRKYQLLNNGVDYYVVGRHNMNKWSAIWSANICRIFQLGWWRARHSVDVSFSNGFQAALLSRIFGERSYTFGDDPEISDYLIKNLFSTQVYYCIVDKSYLPENHYELRNAKFIKCLKEWAYLNPRTFVPRVEVLKRYGVKPKEYMFLREVTVGTINYTGQESGAILGIKDMIPKGMKVLFSLEEKKRLNEYPADWILLQEPIEDIHSLIYYSAGLVSSGDSMAREAALLGVPAYYLGIRYSMPANAAASKVASLQNRMTMPFEEWVKGLTNERVNELTSEKTKRLIEEQKKLREHIDAEFIDINQYMLDLVERGN